MIAWLNDWVHLLSLEKISVPRPLVKLTVKKKSELWKLHVKLVLQGYSKLNWERHFFVHIYCRH